MIKIIYNKQKLTTVKLADLCEIKVGIPAPKHFDSCSIESLPFFRISNIGNKNILKKEDTLEFLSSLKYKNNIISGGSILIAKSGESINKKRRVRIFQDSIIVSHLASLKNKDHINNDYFYYLIKANNIEDAIIKKSTMPSISLLDLKNYTLQYNCDNIQQKNIAKLLSMQEEQIETIKRLIKNVEKRNQYYAGKLLSGELRVKENSETGQIEFYENTKWKEEMVNGVLTKIPSDWIVNKVLEHISLTKGISINSSLFNYENKGFVFLRTGDVWEDSSSKKETVFFDGAIDEKYIKKEEDYVACFEGFNKKINEGTIGLVTNTGEGIISSHLYKIKNKNINGQYFSISLIKNINIQTLLMRHAVGSTVLSSTKCLKDLEFSFPFKEEEFILMEKILASEYQSYEQLKKLLPKEEKRFQWMLDNLLSGEYEVIDED